MKHEIEWIFTVLPDRMSANAVINVGFFVVVVVHSIHFDLALFCFN